MIKTDINEFKKIIKEIAPEYEVLSQESRKKRIHFEIKHTICEHIFGLINIIF